LARSSERSFLDFCPEIASRPPARFQVVAGLPSVPAEDCCHERAVLLNAWDALEGIGAP
jgi:hypothetical protein